jgi:hypothetical protein
MIPPPLSVLYGFSPFYRLNIPNPSIHPYANVLPVMQPGIQSILTNGRAPRRLPPPQHAPTFSLSRLPKARGALFTAPACRTVCPSIPPGISYSASPFPSLSAQLDWCSTCFHLCLSWLLRFFALAHLYRRTELESSPLRRLGPKEGLVPDLRSTLAAGFTIMLRLFTQCGGATACSGSRGVLRAIIETQS